MEPTPTHIIIYKDNSWPSWNCVPVSNENRLRLELGVLHRLEFEEVRVIKVASETIIKQTPQTEE